MPIFDSDKPKPQNRAAKYYDVVDGNFLRKQGKGHDCPRKEFNRSASYREADRAGTAARRIYLLAFETSTRVGNDAASTRDGLSVPRRER